MNSSAKLTVLYFAALREQSGCDSEVIDVALPINAADLYAQRAQHYGFTLPQQRLRAAVNHSFCDWTQPLAANDIVAFIPPIAGG